MKLRLLTEERFRSVAVIVIHNDSVLFGESTANDGRKGKLCFPGGRIEKGETPEQAAVRECQEETGYKVEVRSKTFGISESPRVAHVYCRLVGGAPKPNHEFTILEWIPYDQVTSRDDLYYLNKKALEALKPQASL